MTLLHTQARFSAMISDLPLCQKLVHSIETDKAGELRPVLVSTVTATPASSVV